MGFAFEAWQELQEVRRVQDAQGLLLDTILQQVETIMAVTEDTKALVGKLNEATNTVAAEIQTLKDKIPAPGSVITETDAQEIDTGLQSVIDRLNSFGQDPNNPIPPAPPTPAPVQMRKTK